MKKQTLTRALRQRIIREFAQEHGGVYDAGQFLAHVASVGEKHPAYGWFEWDTKKAAHNFRLAQARNFANGLMIRFEVQTLVSGKYVMAERSMPLVLSPLESRANGGGYVISDPADETHMREYCTQASASVRWLIARYSAAIEHAGGSVGDLERLERLLHEAGDPAAEAA